MTDNNSLLERLLPCPFCDYPKAVLSQTDETRWWVAECPDDDENPGCGANLVRSTKAAVIRAWNTRSPQQATEIAAITRRAEAAEEDWQAAEAVIARLRVARGGDIEWQAREFLAVALERNDQLASAKAMREGDDTYWMLPQFVARDAVEQALSAPIPDTEAGINSPRHLLRLLAAYRGLSDEDQAFLRRIAETLPGDGGEEGVVQADKDAFANFATEYVNIDKLKGEWITALLNAFAQHRRRFALPAPTRHGDEVRTLLADHDECSERAAMIREGCDPMIPVSQVLAALGGEGDA